ncbi:MAG: hypothetical protein Q7R93_05580 [bacterium]|nr:hypothetical protein [bacterium]
MNESEWDSRLTTSPDNPFPLAPKDLVRKGLVTERIYQDQNRKFGRFCRRLMLKELPTQEIAIGDELFWELLGAGMCRDFGWIADAVRRGLGINIRDNSKVACQGTIQFLRSQNIYSGVTVRETEVEFGWEAGEIKDSLTSVYYASQFIQVQDRETMQRMLRHLGAFLGLQGKKRVIYLVHPLGEDNPPEKVEWGKTTPYFFHELRKGLEEGLNSRVRMQVLGEHMHYHQKYNLIKAFAA